MMNSLAKALRQGKQLRAIGFDDTPFDKSIAQGQPVNITGVVGTSLPPSSACAR